MSDFAIRVDNLGKHYRIGSRRLSQTFRESMVGLLAAPFRTFSSRQSEDDQRSQESLIWALKDVSFDVRHGEVVGLIGRNGAGKSTLLKILSRITKPSKGYAEISGRVGSLLEVGTGFHPELTGRENIYLNGAILGITRKDIACKFSEIVEFAEVEKFIDTPVKHYSSGMYMRLAFAVAAHLEADVLLVDEVLAVGDAAFQKKCLGKMSEVAKQGRTVLFVSHNMAAVANLCSRVFLLDGGTIVAEGEFEPVMRRYLRGGDTDIHSDDLSSRKNRSGHGNVRFTRITIEDGNGNVAHQGSSGQPLVIALTYRSGGHQPLKNCRISVAVHDSLGQVLFNCSSELVASESVALSPEGIVRCHIPRLPLSQGLYLLSPFLEVNREIEDWIHGASQLTVVDGDFFGTGRLYPAGWRGTGVLVPHQWDVVRKSVERQARM